jgi:hypothetical protein
MENPQAEHDSEDEPNTRNPRKAREIVATIPRDATETRVDATLADSFPASDSPSWTLGVSTDVSP